MSISMVRGAFFTVRFLPPFSSIDKMAFNNSSGLNFVFYK